MLSAAAHPRSLSLGAKHQWKVENRNSKIETRKSKLENRKSKMETRELKVQFTKPHA
jgi:hypothetical protein